MERSSYCPSKIFSNMDYKEHEETIRIEHNEAEYLRKNGVYVSMTNRGKKSRSK